MLSSSLLSPLLSRRRRCLKSQSACFVAFGIIAQLLSSLGLGLEQTHILCVTVSDAKRKEVAVQNNSVFSALQHVVCSQEIYLKREDEP